MVDLRISYTKIDKIERFTYEFYKFNDEFMYLFYRDEQDMNKR